MLLALVAIATVLPLFAARHLPFTDLPEHAAVASAIAHWHDPAFRVAEHYTFAFPRTPYVLFHVLAAGLTLLVGDAEVAVRVLLVAIGLGFPLSLRSLLAAFGADRRLALFAPLVFFGRPLVMGFLPFLASVPVLVFAVAMAVRCARAPTARRRLGLAAVGVVLFYLHVSSFVTFVATAGALVLYLRGPRRALVEVMWLLPAAIACVVWVASGRLAHGGTGFLSASEVDYASAGQAIGAFPFWLHDVWRSHVDEACAVAWWAALLLAAAASLRAASAEPREIAVRLVPLGCALAVYFATPHHAGVALFLSFRLAPLLALFAIPILRPPAGSPLTKASRLLVVAATLAMSVFSAREIALAEAEEMEGFDALLARIRPASRVIALNFERRSTHAQFAPWLHVVTYHRVRTGGLTAYSFAILEHWPLQYTAGGAPPRKDDPHWSTNPCVYRNAEDGAFFDYVLVRGNVDPFVDEPPGPRFRLAGQARAFRLYVKTDEPPRPPWPLPDQGPCVRLTPPAE